MDHKHSSDDEGYQSELLESQKHSAGQELYAAKVNSLGSFMLGIIHDIRNSLHVVSSSTFMINRRSDDPLIHSHLEAITKTIDRTNGLVDRILAFANDSEERLGIIELSSSIDESVQLTRPMFPEMINICWHKPEKEMNVLGDHGQLYQVVLNLLKNAIEAIGRDKQGDIKVSLVHVYPWAELRISDSGPGIAEDVIDQIFTPAFTTKDDGNGFGLSNVYEIIKKHGGTMQVISQQGEGAEFIILLPLIPELHV